MSQRDVAISSREVSVQVVADEIKIAQIGVPGPAGAQGPQGPQGDAAFGRWAGEWNSAQSYTPGDIVSWQAGAGQGYGTYLCYATTEAGIAPSNTDYWEVMATPGSQGGTADPIPGPPGPTGIRWRGGWTTPPAGTVVQYRERDVVLYEKSAWICTKGHGAERESHNPYDDDKNAWAVLVVGGQDGEDGADGKTIRSGTGTPAAGLGVIGDLYIETDVMKVYGPKTADGWGTGVKMEGTDGTDGTDGKDALSWIALHFDGDGTLRFVAPEACVVRIPDAVSAGTGSHQVYVNGSIETTNQTVASGAVIAVVANNVGNFYVLSLPVVKAA